MKTTLFASLLLALVFIGVVNADVFTPSFHEDKVNEGIGPMALRKAIASVRDPKQHIEDISPLRRGLFVGEGHL